LPAGAALVLSASFDLVVRFEGERFREFDRRGVELDRAGADGWAF
jgi:hypothetical protein